MQSKKQNKQLIEGVLSSSNLLQKKDAKIGEKNIFLQESCLYHNPNNYLLSSPILYPTVSKSLKQVKNKSKQLFFSFLTEAGCFLSFKIMFFPFEDKNNALPSLPLPGKINARQYVAFNY